MGLAVPQLALSVALQQPRHRQLLEALAAMLQSYQQVRPAPRIASVQFCVTLTLPSPATSSLRQALHWN